MAYREKKCRICEQQIHEVDCKDVNLLQGFISFQGKIINRKRTGNCAKHQRAATQAIKRARFLALLPYIGDQ
ncbi:MAG: 30S ribosomal protein S18 [Parcubacteria group bacterium]|nr:30S ribosomal protein S18 [Parcubacteria group bacterium]